MIQIRGHCVGHHFIVFIQGKELKFLPTDTSMVGAFVVHGKAWGRCFVGSATIVVDKVFVQAAKRIGCFVAVAGCFGKGRAWQSYFGTNIFKH